VSTQTQPRPDPLRFFSQVIKDQKNLNLEGQGFVRALFVNCQITRLRNTTLAKCTMSGCSLEPADIRDILGITITLNCHTWDHFRMSPLTLDAILYLITRGAAPEEQERVRSVIDPHRRDLFAKVFPLLEYGALNDGLS
jgi:hypothetical protein